MTDTQQVTVTVLATILAVALVRPVCALMLVIGGWLGTVTP